MKKLVILAAVIMVAGGAALASSISVPFFNDAGTVGYPPSTGTASYIGVTNTTGKDIVLHVQYLIQDAQGVVVDASPVADTVLLAAHSARSWRPAISDDMEGANKDIVPMQILNGVKWGSCTISWDGSADGLDPAAATDVQGRLLQIGPANGGDTAMYTLPAGK